MKDHNWSRGGYGTLMLPWTLKYSSNIGVSRIIDKFYHDQPEKFVQKIHSFGLATDYKVPIPGYVPGIIRMPKKNKRGQYTNWSKTALPWMSIGYETQIPPLQTVTFYNAIANGGKLVRPRLVKAIMRDGEVVQEFPVQVVKEQIAKPQTIEWIQRILREVVSEGLGKRLAATSLRWRERPARHRCRREPWDTRRAAPSTCCPSRATSRPTTHATPASSAYRRKDCPPRVAA